MMMMMMMMMMMTTTTTTSTYSRAIMTRYTKQLTLQSKMFYPDAKISRAKYKLNGFIIHNI
jgi:hypothetical protein